MKSEVFNSFDKNYFVAALLLSFDDIAFYFLHFKIMPF
jgi:hypothetical protein